MKLYDRVHRIHRELAAQSLSPDQPLKVSDLTPFDQFHYHGTKAVEEAIAALGLKPGMRVLDIGAGLGGPARYIAEKTGAHVTALELQEDLSARLLEAAGAVRQNAPPDDRPGARPHVGGDRRRQRDLRRAV